MISEMLKKIVLGSRFILSSFSYVMCIAKIIRFEFELLYLEITWDISIPSRAAAVNRLCQLHIQVKSPEKVSITICNLSYSYTIPLYQGPLSLARVPLYYGMDE